LREEMRRLEGLRGGDQSWGYRTGWESHLSARARLTTAVCSISSVPGKSRGTLVHLPTSFANPPLPHPAAFPHITLPAPSVPGDHTSCCYFCSFPSAQGLPRPTTPMGHSFHQSYLCPG
uniref:Uncharacterized protein n=1 Tax=Apteryx owenii TaxID=8824 RepID=A0A8B9S421_APTOW